MRAKGFQAKTGNQLAVRDGLALEMLTVKTVSILIAASSDSASDSEEYTNAFNNITREKHMIKENVLIAERVASPILQNPCNDKQIISQNLMMGHHAVSLSPPPPPSLLIFLIAIKWQSQFNFFPSAYLSLISLRPWLSIRLESSRQISPMAAIITGD